MKTIRFAYLLVALLALGQVAFAGGMLEAEAEKKEELPRHELVKGPGAEAPEMMMEAGDASQMASPATTTAQSAAAVTRSGQSHQELRLSKREKKAMRMRVRKNRKQLRASLFQFRKHKKDASPKADDTELILLVILAILLPPLAVFLYEGATTNFWIDLILTLFFFIPGVIFALIVILR